jgi:hypothetical protein
MMTAKHIVQSIEVIFKDAWKWHRLTLGLMVVSVFESERLTITEMGRALYTDTVPKHAIKRVDRWLGNRRFDDKKAREQLLRVVIGPRPKVRIAIDWTKLRRWPVLVAGVVQRGRSVPVLWAVADPEKLYKSQNAFEHGFFAWLKATLPKGVEAILVLDRGFKRVDIVSHLKGFEFVIRTGGNVHVRSSDYCGRMDGLICRRGVERDIANAVLRPSRPVTVRVVGMWEKRSKEPWLLMTNMLVPARQIVALYAKRFQIEEMFRDQKDWRFGLQAGHTLVRSAARLERLLVVAALVHLFAMLIGAAARNIGLDRGFRANTVRNRATHSDFALGMYYALRNNWSRSILFENFYLEGWSIFGG